MRRLRLARPRRALIVAPHPDDEVIGAYGLMRSLRRRGCDVRVLVVTDGAGSHRASARWPTARLVAERRRETRRALGRIGVAADRITFLALPDGRLGLDGGDARSIGRALRRMRHLDLVVGPASSDAHPDHRATAVALAGTPLPGVRRLAYRVWGEAASRGCPLALPLHRLRTEKRAAIRRYRTQMGAIADDPAGFAIAPHELRAFSRATEYYMEGRR